MVVISVDRTDDDSVVIPGKGEGSRKVNNRNACASAG